jgi:methylmalonyl-CoA mutase cobalamin-binding domain/chain
MSAAMEEVFGRYTAQIRTIGGVYSAEAGQDESVLRAQALVEEFEAEQGRRPRILVAKMGQDGHDRGQKVIATAFADLGFDVDVGPLFQTPAEVARQAVEADVHVVGVSSLAAGHLTLVPALRHELDALGREDLMIVVGGVIPAQDFEALRAAGADAIYPPGTVISTAAIDLIGDLRERLAAPGCVRAGASVGTRGRGGTAVDVAALAEAVRSGSRAHIARAITLVESTRADHREAAGALIRELTASTGSAVRVGISGVPGAGKSTFIDAMGCRLLDRGNRVAVVAVDPSSRRTGGSILGDRTRMAAFASREGAFVRPSPSGRHLGEWRGRRASRCSCSRPPATTSSSSRRWGWGRTRSRSRRWSTPSCC